ncbi:MAG: right-handed parallel beta-helix repeat-containing protein, partial [Pseudomonadota bacterium]
MTQKTQALAIVAGFALATVLGATGAAAQDTFQGFPINEPAAHGSKKKKTEKKGEEEVVVNKNGSGKYQTISAALEDIAEGGIIHVRRGVYDEEIRLTKSVKIIGERDGERSLVEIAPPPNASNCLVFAPEKTSSSALVENVRFMVDANAVSTACVDVRGGIFTIKNSDVLGNRHGVGVRVSDGTSVIEGNRITQLAKGVEIDQRSSDSSAFILSNTITSNIVGVDAAGYSDVTMSGNVVHANASMGVFAETYGNLELVGNEFTSNRIGVELQNNARRVVFRANTVSENTSHGVYAPNGIRGTIEDS